MHAGNRTIDKICYDENLDKPARVHLVAGVTSTMALYALFDHYNWDDGFEVPTAIAKNPACDLAVAQRLYWLAAANEWYPASVPDRKPYKWEKEHHAFSTLIGKRIVDGEYPPGPASHDQGFSRSDVQDLERDGFPEVLYVPVVGKAGLVR